MLTRETSAMSSKRATRPCCMTTTRSYRAAMPADVAERELRECAGTQLDPAVVAEVLTSIAPSRGGFQTITSAEPAPAAAVPVAQ